MILADFCLFKYVYNTALDSRLDVTGGTQRICRIVPQMSRPVINPETAEQNAACFEKDLDCFPLNKNWFIFVALHQIVGLLSWKQAYAFFPYGHV